MSTAAGTDADFLERKESAVLGTTRSGLRFIHDPTEREYRLWHARAALPFQAPSVAALVMLVSLCLLAQHWAARPRYDVLLVWGAWITVVALPRLFVARRPALLPWVQPLAALSLANAGLTGVGFTLWILHAPDIALAGAVLVTFFPFVIVRLRPALAMSAALPVWLLHDCFVILHPPSADAFVLAAHLMMSAGSLCAGFIAGVAVDRASRRQFSQERIIEAQRTTIERERARSEALFKQELAHQVAERSRELGQLLLQSEISVGAERLSSGDTFDGRYVVVRELGVGGMGHVYEVERTTDRQRLALKVVTAVLHAKQAARFAREAEIGARLRHENLVSIVDVGIAAGAVPFLVMELVQGGSLEDKRALFGDSKWAVPILRQIALGLAELHANAVVHRDLKPGNVLLVENGVAKSPLAKISDFGISRFGAPDDGTDVARSPSPGDLTETGALMGTPLYMPPEAWFGAARHPSADVFSFGVLAYEALTGRSPFAVPAVLLVRSRQPIPTPAPLDGVAPDVAAAVLACLQAEPSQRPRAKELADRLSVH